MKTRLRLIIGKNKKLFMAALALMEVVVLLCTASFAWIEGSKEGRVDDNTSTISAGTGLVFIGEDIKDGVISLDNNLSLKDCSSADGRNFFFPTTGSIGKTNTENLVFRQGTVADINSGYISVDFAVSSSAASSVENGIYISNTSSVTSTDGANLNALRIAINFNDGTPPVLLCPGRTTPGYTQDTDAVTSIDESGAATTSVSSAESFSSYWYGASPLANIRGGESKKITVTIWLEGTDESCTSDNYLLKNFSIDLTLTTASDYVKKITFVDYSPSQWVDNKSPNGETFMFAYDKLSGDETQATRYLMQETITDPYSTYTVYVPESVTDVGFARLDSTSETMSYNYWADTNYVHMSDSDINTYYAIGQGESVDAGMNRGYWVKGDDAEMVEVYLLDSGKMDSTGYNPNLKIINDTAYAPSNLQPGHGLNMRLIGENSGKPEEKIYHMIVPRSAKIQFNGSDRGSAEIDLSRATLYNPTDPNDTVKKIGYSLNSYSGTSIPVSTWDPTGSILDITNPVPVD